MGVCIDRAGKDKLSSCIYDFRFLFLEIRSDCCDLTVDNSQIRLIHLRRSNNCSVFDNQIHLQYLLPNRYKKDASYIFCKSSCTGVTTQLPMFLVWIARLL